MKQTEKEMEKKNIFLIVSVVLLIAAVLCALLELILPESGFAAWFRTVFDVKEIFGKFAGNHQTLLRGIIWCGAIYCLSVVLRWILSKVMEKSNRAKTVVNIFSGFIKYACAIAILFIILWVCGVNTTALWASAGVLTLVIGLGCQSLIADIVAGLFIIFENEYQVGEIIVVDGFRGSVKEIGIRTTKILDQAGDIKIINNSNIKNIVNLSRELSLAVCECGVEYQDSIERIELILDRNLKEMKEKISGIVDGPFYKGVSQLGDSSVVIKIIARCKEEDRYQVQRDMNRELKLIFDRNNVNIPFPQIVLNQPSAMPEETVPVERSEARKFVEHQKNVSKDLEEQEL